MMTEKRPARETQADRICVGAVVGAHGIKGTLRVRSFTENPEDLTAYGPATDEAGERVFKLSVEGRAKNDFLVRVAGVSDRDTALALKGTRFYVPRAALPEPEEGEYYHGDLIGLRVEDGDGNALGSVRGVHNFGAGDVLEIGAESGATLMIPFTHQAAPEIDLKAGRMRVNPEAGSGSQAAHPPKEPPQAKEGE